MNDAVINNEGAIQRSLWLRILLPVLLFTPIIPVAALVGGSKEAKAAVGDVCGTNNTPNVISLADPTFYIDSGITPKLDATYSGYTIRAGTSSETNLSIELSGFTGGVVGLATYQNAHVTLPVLAPGEATTSFFLLAASGPTEIPQAHTITLLRGGTELCSRTFTYSRVAETIKALANKVDSVVQSKPNSTAQVGDQIIVTVEGHTGTLGAGPSYDPGVLSYAPTAIKNFPAGAWRLETTEMSISPNGTLPVTKYTNRLFLSGASGPDRPYVAKYYFKAVDSTSVKATVNPVQFIASGTQVKHTDIGGSIAGDLPIVDPDANITITKSVTPSLFSPVSGAVTGGTASYSLAVKNIGTTTGYLDKIVDTLPANVTFKSGTATVGGRAAVPTFNAGANTLTFYGPISVGAGATLTVAYQTTIPNTVGVYTNSAVGYYGNTVIDNSASTLISSPATATVSVRPAFGAVDAINDTTSTSANTALTIAVLTNDTPTTGVTVTITRQPSGGSMVVNAGGTVTYTPTPGFGGTDTFEYKISNGDTSDTAVVTVKVPQARKDFYTVYKSKNNTAEVKTWTTADGLLANDFCSTTTCTVTSATVSLGSISLAADLLGGFTYTTPQADSQITSTPAITYTLKDSNNKTASGTGIIYVADLAPDRASTSYKTTKNIDVSVNDYCNGTCTPTYKNDASHGSVADGPVITLGKSLAYTPFDHFMGVDTFTYGKGVQVGNVTVLVGAPDASINTTYGQAVSQTVGSTTYLDTHGGTGSTASNVSCTDCVYSISAAPSKGAVSIVSSTGAFTYTPSTSASGQDTFYVQISEPGGLQVASKVDIFIGPLAQNDPSATTTTAYQYLMKNGTPLSFNVLDNDSCPATCTVTKLTNPTVGTVTQTTVGGGAFTYTNSTAIGDYSFTYQVASSVSPGLTSSATVRINVSGGADDAGVTSPGLPLTLNIRSNDPCTECALTAVSKPSIGTASLNSNGTITYVAPAAFAGIANFTYTLTLNGKSTVINVVVTVKPDAINDQISSLSGATNIFDVLANDVCSSCQITSTSNVTGGSATVAVDGYSVSYTAPSSGGPFYFDYTITDSATGQTDIATVKISIATFPTAVNDTATTQTLKAVEINVRGNDTCTNAPCTYDVSSDASHGAVSLSLDPLFEFQYIPSAGFTGTDTFKYSITTSLGMTQTATVTVYVTPTASDDSAVAGKNQTKIITVTSNDVCLTCSVSIVTSPSAGSIGSISGGDITYNAPSTPGIYMFTYRLTETDTSPTSTVDAVVAVVVGDASPDKVATNYQTPVTLNVTSNDTCVTSNCTVTSVDVSGGQDGDSAVIVDAVGVDTSITYTPPSGFIGLVNISYTANWSSTSATATVTILVGPLALTRQADRNTSIAGNVLNGTSCSGCVVSLVSAPGFGEVTFNTDGAYTYTPYKDWLGTDSAITYRITDPASGLTRDGTLTVSVASLTASIQITKVGIVDPTYNGNTSRTGPGDRVNYTFSVKNTGPIDLVNVVVVDDKIVNDATDISCPGTSSNTISSLVSGATVVCTGFDTLKLADINLGYIDNTATATGVRKSSVASMSVRSMSVSSAAPESQAETQPSAAPTYDVIDNATTRVSLDRIASMTLLKAATGVTDGDNNGTDAGDIIGYSYAVTNTGNVTLYNATVIDDKIENDATDIDCPSGGTSNVIASIDPGVTVTCVGTYAALQADIDAGKVTNTGTVFATAPSGVTDPDPANSGITVLLAAGTKISIAKTHGAIANTNASNPSGGVGDQVTYTYTVTNTGNQGLVNVIVTDDKIASSSINCAGGGTNTKATLAKDASFTCVATYTFTQADFDLGSVTNIGTATGDPASGGVGPSNTATDNVSTGEKTPSMTIAKTGVLNAGANLRADAGDTISYSYLVTNTGNTTLTAVTVTDDKIAPAGIVCPAPSSSNVVASLAPGATATCVGSYSVLQADMNTGSVTNRGTVTSGTTTSFSDETVALIRVSTMTIVKSGVLSVGSNSRADAGDLISYSYLVTNTGNVTLSNVTVTDNKIASDGILCPSPSTSNVVGTIAPAATATCVATYTVTQADIDAASVTNRGTATSGSTTSFDDKTVALLAAPSLTVTKSGSLNVGSNSRADAGDTVSYSYVVTNTGNTTLSNVTVIDDKIADDATNIDCPSGGTSNVIATLAPASSVTCVASYTVTQANIDAGSVSNTATASSGSTTTTGSATVTLTREAAMTLVKTSAGIHDVNGNGTDAGDTVNYNFLVTNTGNVTLNSLTVVDDKIADDAANIDCPSGGTSNVIATLAPSVSVTCVGSYVLTADDITSTSVTNIGTLSASVPSGVSALSAVTSTATVTLAVGAGVGIVKTHAPIVNTNTSNPSGGAGDQVTYTYSVTNTGTAPLTNVSVTDDKISSSAIKCASGNTNTVASLAASGTFTCVATYTFTQSDVDAGGITNIGTVSGTPSGGSAVTDTDTDSVATITRAGAMTIAKSGTVNTGVDSRADSGDTITYSYLVTNTGNITLSNMTVTDDKIADSSVNCPSPSTTNVIATLAPGASATCTGTYSVTQSNINTGSVTNIVTLAASVPTGATNISDVTDTETVTLASAPSLSLAKSGSLNAGNGRADAGDTVSYSYVIRNNGNVTLTSIAVTDDKIPSDADNIDCPSPSTNNVIASLDPGETATCVAIYTVIQADVDAGEVTNTGTATSGSTTTTGSKTVTLAAAPVLGITKSGTLNAGSNNVADLGETISYSYVITNTGNVTLANVTVTDDKIASSAIQCPSGTSSNVVASMTPGATTTCVATYSVTQANIDAGLITNIGTVSSGATSNTSSKTITLAGSPSLELVKAGTLNAGANSRADVGDTISYSFAVKNTGNVTLSNVAVTDDRISNDAVNIDCPSGGANNVIATLEPAQTVTCVASYVVTQSNLDMGSVTNTGTATNGITTATGSKTVTLTAAPSVTIAKSGVLNVGSNGRVDAGDVITYSFVVKNTGNVTLANVTVTDDKILNDSVNIQCPNGANTNVKLSLSPGESVTCVGDYVVTQSDINSGSVTNIGSVSATPATGGTTTADNTVAVAMTSPTTTTTIAPTTTSTLAPITTVAPTTTSSEVTATTTSSSTSLSSISTTSVTANDDSVTAPMGAILDIDVLANDSGSGLSIRSVSKPNIGETKTDGKTIVVTPDVMFKGAIDFTYVVSDGSVNSTGKVVVKLVGNTLQVLPTIFLDINGNSKRDALEPGIRGISFDLGLVARKTLKVKAGETAKGSANVSASGLENVQATAVSAQARLAQFVCQSNSRGECVSEGLPLGMYSVEANVNLKKLGLSVTADSDGAYDLKATVDPRGNGQPDAEFGLNGTGSVLGYSFIERGDVVSFDPKVDVPLRNIKVTVRWAGLDGEFESTDDVSIATTTDSKGRYSLQGLPIGDYRVEPVVASFKGVTPPPSGDVTVKTRSVEQFNLPVRIDGPIPDGLVQTGADAWQLLLVALLSMLGGVLLVVVKPTRRENG